MWVQFPPGTSIFCNNDRENSLLLFLFYLAIGGYFETINEIENRLLIKVLIQESKNEECIVNRRIEIDDDLTVTVIG